MPNDHLKCCIPVAGRRCGTRGTKGTAASRCHAGRPGRHLDDGSPGIQAPDALAREALDLGGADGKERLHRGSRPAGPDSRQHRLPP